MEDLPTRLFIACTACVVVWTVFAHAETVDVQHCGPVSLANFDCEEVESRSFISAICYASEDQNLLIEINEKWFEFCDVEMYSVDKLRAAPSKGQFFNEEIAHHATNNLFKCKP
jgi:hypothetical protein